MVPQGGERAFWDAPRSWGKNVTLPASITAEGVGPCLAVEGPTTGEGFEAYLENVLVPTLSAGQIVVPDNLSAHKGGGVKEFVEGRGCELTYLSPYSPDWHRPPDRGLRLPPSVGVMMAMDGGVVSGSRDGNRAKNHAPYRRSETWQNTFAQ